MNRSVAGRMVVGLDIGTSKIVAIVGELGPEGQLEIIGIGSHVSRGLKKGVVVNIDSTVQSIQRAVEEADLWLVVKYSLSRWYRWQSHFDSHGIFAIRDREVSAIKLLKQRRLLRSTDQKILHILPEEFLIDS